MKRSVDDLIRIVLAGGGVHVDSGIGADSLRRIALAGSNKQVRIVVRVTSAISTDDLALVALAGKGCVEFDFPS